MRNPLPSGQSILYRAIIPCTTIVETARTTRRTRTPLANSTSAFGLRPSDFRLRPAVLHLTASRLDFPVGYLPSPAGPPVFRSNPRNLLCGNFTRLARRRPRIIAEAPCYQPACPLHTPCIPPVSPFHTHCIVHWSGRPVCPGALPLQAFRRHRWLVPGAGP